MKLLRLSDFLGVKASINFERNYSSHKSVYGGILSIIISILMVCGAGYFSQQFFLRINYNLVSNISDDLLVSYNNFNDIPFMIRLSGDYSRYIEDSYYNITTERVTYSPEENGSAVVESLSMEKCDINKHFRNREKMFQSNINNLETYYCIDWNNKTFNLTGTYGKSKLQDFIVIFIDQCDRISEETREVECASHDILEQSLSIVYVDIITISYKIDHNKQQSVEETVAKNRITASNSVFKRIWFSYQHVVYKSDFGYIFESIQEQSFFRVKDCTYDIDLRENYPFVLITIFNDYERLAYEKSYMKAQTLLANIGGIVRGLTIIGFILNFPISNNLYNLKLVNSVYNRLQFIIESDDNKSGDIRNNDDNDKNKTRVKAKMYYKDSKKSIYKKYNSSLDIKKSNLYLEFNNIDINPSNKLYNITSREITKYKNYDNNVPDNNYNRLITNLSYKENTESNDNTKNKENSGFKINYQDNFELKANNEVHKSIEFYTTNNSNDIQENEKNSFHSNNTNITKNIKSSNNYFNSSGIYNAIDQSNEMTVKNNFMNKSLNYSIYKNIYKDNNMNSFDSNGTEELDNRFFNNFPEKFNKTKKISNKSLFDTKESNNNINNDINCIYPSMTPISNLNSHNKSIKLNDYISKSNSQRNKNSSNYDKRISNNNNNSNYVINSNLSNHNNFHDRNVKFNLTNISSAQQFIPNYDINEKDLNKININKKLVIDHVKDFGNKVENDISKHSSVFKRIHNEHNFSMNSKNSIVFKPQTYNRINKIEETNILKGFKYKRNNNNINAPSIYNTEQDISNSLIKLKIIKKPKIKLSCLRYLDPSQICLDRKANRSYFKSIEYANKLLSVKNIIHLFQEYRFIKSLLLNDNQKIVIKNLFKTNDYKDYKENVYRKNNDNEDNDADVENLDALSNSIKALIANSNNIDNKILEVFNSS